MSNQQLLQIYIEDDWGDNSLTGRSNTDEGFFEHPKGDTRAGDYLKAVNRPEWATRNGTPAANNQQLEMPAGNTTRQRLVTPSDFIVGSWKYDFNPDSGLGAGTIAMIIMTSTIDNPQQTSGDGYILQAHNDGSYDLRRVDSGVGSDIVSSTWPDDSSNHEKKATRDEVGNWESFLDNTSKGTATDNTYRIKNVFGIENSSDSAVDIDNLALQ